MDDLKKVETVDSKMVAKFFITPEFAKTMLRVLTEGLERHGKAHG
jgi:hypothetical protein